MKRLGVGVVALVACAAGCTITASDHQYHERHESQPVVVEGDNPPPPQPEERAVTYREERNDPPPPPPERREERVVWYRELADMGMLDNYLPAGFAGEARLRPGVYHLRGGKIKFRNVAGGLKILGSGTGQTIIEGDIDARGDNFVFRDFSLTGSIYLKGADCQVHIYVEGVKDVSGPRLNMRWQDRPERANPQPRPQPRPQPAPPPPPRAQPAPQPQPAPNNGKLANKGFLDNYLPAGFKGEVFLAPGIYKLRGGKIKFGGGGLIIHGAGKENTFIEGDMSFKGDGYVIDQLSIKGDVEVRGNNNFGDVLIHGSPDIRGGNNRGWGRGK